MDNIHTIGKTTIAPEVLHTIARLTALSIPGVSRLAVIPDVDRLFRKTINEGVKITVENNTVYADIYVIIQNDYNVREVSHAIQTQVARAISEIVGMDVGNINIHVEDIDFSETN